MENENHLGLNITIEQYIRNFHFQFRLSFYALTAFQAWHSLMIILAPAINYSSIYLLQLSLFKLVERALKLNNVH